MEKNKTVLFISYIDMNNFNTGSSVRPIAMYKAFIESGYKVIYIKNKAAKSNKKNRVKEIKEIRNWLKYNKPDFCYIESPSDPLIFKEDRKLIKYIKKRDVKIAYFYRDAYYKIGKDTVFNNYKFLSRDFLRYLYYKFLYWKDEFLLKKYVDIVYFPSKELSKYFNFKNMKVLPPAGNAVKMSYNTKQSDLIYVGGVSERYGIALLLKSLKIINKTQPINLILVCREKELANIDDEYISCPWLKIVHASGIDELKKYYKKARIALIPLLPNVYNNLAVPIKLYEYMSMGIPIVSTPLTEVANVINKYNIGLISKNSPYDFADKVLSLYNNEKLLNTFSSNSLMAIKKENLWINRVKSIEKDMNVIER